MDRLRITAMSSENHTLASLEAVQSKSAEVACAPSPAASEALHATERLSPRGRDCTGLQLPDGIPAWTQSSALSDGGLRPHSPAPPVCAALRRGIDTAHTHASWPGHCLAQGLDGTASKMADRSCDEEEAGEYEEAWAGACDTRHGDRQTFPVFGGANWQDVKWLVMTNAATLLVGVYIGHACASSASPANTCPSTAPSREALPTSRVA